MSAVSAFTSHDLLHWSCWSNPTAVVICLLTCVGGEGRRVSAMKMTRPDLIVVSICGSRQDVCLNVYLSVCPSVSLLSWRHALCQLVETLWLQSAIMGTDLIQQEYRVHSRNLSRPDSIIITTHSLMEAFSPVSLVLNNVVPDVSSSSQSAVQKPGIYWLFGMINSCLYLYVHAVKYNKYTNVSHLDTFLPPISSPAWHI